MLLRFYGGWYCHLKAQRGQTSQMTSPPTHPAPQPGWPEETGAVWASLSPQGLPRWIAWAFPQHGSLRGMRLLAEPLVFPSVSVPRKKKWKDPVLLKAS